jgi:HlyD family secretion protein
MKRHTLFPAASVLLLAAASCQAGPAEPTPTAAPSEPVVPIVSATGQVMPETWAELSVPMTGIVEAVHFGEGEPVQAGDVILQLSGREQLEAAVAAAEVELVAAQQALAEVQDSADVVRAAAQSELANAREALRVARYTWEVQQEGNRANSDTIRTARARLVLAEAEVDDAKDEYDSTSGSASEDPGKAAALAAYMAAKKARDAALRSLNWYTGHPTEIQQAMLDADLAVAEARVAAAERAWADVQEGPDPDALAQAQARLANAQAQARAAQAALADSELRAPFDGTVAAIRIREKEWASPGQTLVVLADLTHLQVETTDLNEIDAARVVPGAKAVVTFDALPEVQAEGTVVRVAPKASEGSGVNYTVLLTLDRVPELLRWGMTAFVDIEAVDSFGG